MNSATNPKNRATSRFLPLSRALIAVALAMALPLQALAAAVELATSPMTTSTSTTVKPNLMFMLDDSGSMAWDYLPDTAKNFSGKYGYNSANCNGAAYNPNTTYSPPVNSTGAPLNATPTTFSAAYDDGYVTGGGTTNLNTGFTGGSGSGSSGINLTPGPAFYYTYTGTQNTTALQTYFSPASTFYQECNSNVGSAPGSGVFTLTRLASVPTTTITVTGGAGGASASIRVTSAGSSSNKAKVSNVKVTRTVGNGGGTIEILKGTTSSTSSKSTLAGYIAAGINACTVAITGNCSAGATGYSAVIDPIDNTKVNITGPANSAQATIAVTFSQGASPSVAVVPFPAINPNNNTTSVSVSGVNLLNATATANTPNTMAAAINTQINAKSGTTGYSSTVSNNIVTITGPTAASNVLPVLTIDTSAGAPLTLATLAFPDSDPVKVQNFANWYSYYSNRMLMMKTGAGLAFNNVSDKFRVGFLTMNNNVSPGIVEVGTFDANQRLAWFNKLYASIPNQTTPLREILSRVGQYYAHKFGSVTTYKATITVGGSGATSVDSATTNGTEMMDDSTPILNTTSAMAAAIAVQINTPQVTDYGASASGNVVTILGPASATGFTPVVSNDGGGMTFTRTAFTGTTVTSQLNGITPADPIQYSCQQNFVILSTDGYWNGSTTYDLNGGTVGNVDALAARPFNDGGQNKDTITISYSRNNASSVACSSPVTGWSRVQTQPQQGSCIVTLAAGASPTGTESCAPSNWTNNGSATFGSCTHVSPSPLPAPNPTTQVETGRVVVVGTNAGVSNTLSDVALYYYQTDLRDNNLGNCTGALGTSVCANDVFQSGSDNNLQQHMTTFTLGLGVRGQMVYSSGYLTDTTGDFVAVKLGSTANSGSIVVSGSGSTSVSSITVNGIQLLDTSASPPVAASTSTSTLASSIAAKITQNGYFATATGSTVNISGPSTGAGFTPTITKSGTMVLTGAAGTGVCSWLPTGSVCNWPVPVSGQPTTVDDLWHAAVNGRGAYFSATDPDSLANGIANALTSISSKVGAAAAAATSTLNPVAGNNQAFVASYTTLTWQGNLEARGINTATGVVNQNANWCVENVAADACVSPGVVSADSSGDTTAYFCVTPGQVTCVGGTLSGTNCSVPIATTCTGTMNAKVTDTTDSRTIYTAAHNSTVSDVPVGSGGVAITDGTALVPFNTAFRSVNPTYFDATTAAKLTQWPVSTDLSADAVYFRANSFGDNLLKFLRGQHGHETGRSSVANVDQFYRNRQSVLGDALESQPAFIGAPIFSYPYPGYPEFVTAQAGRVGTVYMGTNDGMMHALASDTGIERWAYVPSMVIPNMYKLADMQYSGLHTNYVNGSPVTTDICTARCTAAVTSGHPETSPVWKTVMVAGLNGGGRGYFALDITDPTTPSLLWEFSTTTGIGAVKDADLGYTFGQPVVTRKADGTWVVLVASGYDNGTDSAAKVSGSFVANAPAGSGEGYLYVLDAGSGAIISKISTGAGSAATPSGLAKIAGYNAESGGNKVSYVYGGDLLGNLWRFDINAATAASLGTNNIGNGSVLKFATLFSDTAATLPQPIMTTPILGTILGKRIIFIGTGKYLEVADLSNTQKMSQYGIKDDDATATLVNPRTSLVQQYLINNPDGTATRLSAATSGATTSGSNTVDFGSGRGWFLDFPDSRERVNIDAKLVLGTLVVPSIVPSSTDCSPGGTGWLNFFDYTSGGPVNATPGISGVKYDSTIVGVNVLFINGSPVVEVVTSSDPTPTKDPNVQFKGSSANFAGKRVMWRELIPND